MSNADVRVTIDLIRTADIGTSGRNREGVRWVSWQRGRLGSAEPATPETCAICGAAITAGYFSDWRDGGRFVCAEHVSWEATA